MLLLAPIAVIAAGLAYFYLTTGRYESTDNATVETGLTGIAARVSGTVIAVEVTENQLVKKGQVLFRIDPDTYKTAVAEAEAQLSGAQTEVEALRATYRESQSELAEAQARLDYAEAETKRQKSLRSAGIASQTTYEQSVMGARTAQQAIDAAVAKGESVRANLSGDSNLPTDRQPSVRRAQAALDRARIALNDTVVYAPEDGVVTHVHQLQVGDYVTASRPVFVLAGTHFWVEANFKENQLRYMRLGQPATVEVDALPDRELKAHIASFSPGTGNSFSLLPAENATGNWVKVVQRLPIELELDNPPPGSEMHAGLSAEVTVDTGRQHTLFGTASSESLAGGATLQTSAGP